MENLIIIRHLFINFIKSIKYIFKYKASYRKNVENKILVAGGYGYGNVGDEAQCDATLNLLTSRYPEYKIINLTPNIEYSQKEHPKYQHDLASRCLIYNQSRENNIYDFDNSFVKKILFLLKSFILYLNAILVRANFPTIFLSVEAAKFLYELKTAKIFYFCGGGYLTGSTQSRLWDGIMICKCCHLLQIPVVMSGQTIGVWNNKFNKVYAKWGFKNVKLITVRDENDSLIDLEKIQLKGDNYFSTHDDALFCNKSKEKQIQQKNYVVLNFHYWGMNETDKLINFEKLNKIINYILENCNYNIVFIPMHNSDKDCYVDYITKYPNNRFACFDYDYDFRKIRQVIADAKICITMKHHPIIFAMGEGIPVISLVFSKYYLHKNLGALCQYKQEKYSINLENKNCLNEFIELWNDINENYFDIQKVIATQKNILIKRKNKFLYSVDKILNQGGNI